MKNLTFNQLQLRILALLFCLFTCAVFGYRYFIELPKLEQSISKLSERELDILGSGISSLLGSLAKTNFDYAVWTSSYNFMHNPSEEYIEDNYVANTFTSLEIDGVFYLDEHLKPIFVQGFHSTKLIDLTYSFYDFKKYPDNLKILPTPTSEVGVPKKEGFINTVHGPAMYSTVQIRNSDMGGDNRGFLIMVHLLDNVFIEKLSSYTLTKVSYQNLPLKKGLTKLRDWKEKAENVEVSAYSDVALRDENGVSTSVLRVLHSSGKLPSLVNAQNIIFIFLMSLFIYLVYILVTYFIVVPVKKLALDIKERDNNDIYDPLDENYTVRELAVVSQNVNQLMATVKHQNELLEKQVITDSLTGIKNKRGLIEAMEKQQELCIREKIGFVVIMADIDYFKKYNDSEGHLEGDIALHTVANALNDQCKRTGDVCARYGGEEFTLLFNLMDESDLQEKLNDLMGAVNSLGLVHPSSPISETITISMGATIVKATDVVDFKLPIAEIFKVADKALYAAKDNGRDCFVVNHFDGS